MRISAIVQLKNILIYFKMDTNSRSLKINLFPAPLYKTNISQKKFKENIIISLSQGSYQYALFFLRWEIVI